MPELKIARVETFLFDPGAGKNLLFCRVETEDGLHGWGEAYVTPGKEPVIEQCLQAMAKHVIGRSPFNIRHTAQIMFEDFAIRRASLDLMSAWSAIEIAMWDIVAKHAGLPLYNLLGGASRERVRVYANGWSNGSEPIEAEHRARAEGQGDGLHRAEMGSVPRPWRSFIHREDEDHVVRYVRAMREALGPDFGCWSRCIAGWRRCTRSASASASPSSTSAGTRNRACATTSSWSPRCGATCRSRS